MRVHQVVTRGESSRDRRPGSGRAVQLTIPFSTYLGALAVAGAVIALLKLTSLLLLLYFSALIAITLDPVAERLARRMPRGIAVGLLSCALVAAVGTFFYFILPALVEQASTLYMKFPELKVQLLEKFSQDRVMAPLAPLGEKVLNEKTQPTNSSEVLGRAMNVAGAALGGITQFALLIVLGIYLLADGRRAKAWFLHFFTAEKRAKLEETGAEIGRVIFAYVAGQAITSALVVVFSFTLLTYLKVPGALMLAVIAGVFDVLPIIGFFLGVIPAVLLTLTISTNTALIVGVAYLVYHQIENYFIIPMVYGSKMKLSSLVVLIAIIAGGLLGGVPGAIAILPIIASYPVIERVWLKKWLGAEVIARHQQDLNPEIPASALKP